MRRKEDKTERRKNFSSQQPRHCFKTNVSGPNESVYWDSPASWCIFLKIHCVGWSVVKLLRWKSDVIRERFGHYSAYCCTTGAGWRILDGEKELQSVSRDS